MDERGGDGDRIPWDLAAVPPGLVARLSGEAAARATDPRTAPAWLRIVLLRVTAINLRWIASLLDLDPPDGAQWRDI